MVPSCTCLYVDLDKCNGSMYFLFLLYRSLYLAPGQCQVYSQSRYVHLSQYRADLFTFLRNNNNTRWTCRHYHIYIAFLCQILWKVLISFLPGTSDLHTIESEWSPASKEPFLNQLARVILVHNWYRCTSTCFQVYSREYTCSACCHEFWTSLTHVVLSQNWYGFTGTCHHVKNSWITDKHVSTHQICSQNLVNSHTETW